LIAFIVQLKPVFEDPQMIHC